MGGNFRAKLDKSLEIISMVLNFMVTQAQFEFVHV